MYQPSNDESLRTSIDGIFARYDWQQSGCLPIDRLHDYCNEMFVTCGLPTVGREQVMEALHNVYPRAEVINKQMMLAVVKEIRWLQRASATSTVFVEQQVQRPQQQLPMGLYHANMPMVGGPPVVGGPPIYQPTNKSPRNAVSPNYQVTELQPPLLSVSNASDFGQPTNQPYPYQQNYQPMPYQQPYQAPIYQPYNLLKESVVFDVPDQLPPSPRSNVQPRSPRNQPY